MSERATVPTPLAESLRRLETLVSPYTGLIGTADEVLSAPDDIRAFTFSCESADANGLIGHPVSGLGGGSSANRHAARAAALGEAVERYSAACLPRADDLVFASANELGSEAVEPERFVLFHENQYRQTGFPYERFTRSTKVSWVRGASLTTGEQVFLPVQIVLLRAPVASDEPRICQATSNGLACHATLEEATLGGLFEVVERDAFLITWMNRLSLPRLTWAASPGLGELERLYLAPTGLGYAAIDLSAFWRVPTVMGVVRSNSPEQAALGVGASSAKTIEEAVWKALDEAAHVRTWARNLLFLQPNRIFEPDFSDVRDFVDHVRCYAEHSHARHAAFLDAAEETRDVGQVAPIGGTSVTEAIGAILERLAAEGVSAYVVDVTAPDVRAAGLRVAKVVAPELCPLDVDHRARFLGGARLYRAAFQLGLRTAPLSADDLNPFPHPFP
jgi:ribosomal protein S12 methylthiotransferase accessory factor